MITIGKDKIYAWTTEIQWAIKCPDRNVIICSSKSTALGLYCKYLCNPKYNKVHYVCASCPITEAK